MQFLKSNTKVLRKIKTMLCNYLLLGFENTTRVCVSWDDCATPNKVGGLNLASPKDGMCALMNKWIIQAFMPN